MRYKLFISHAVKDKAIVGEFLRFLEYGMNIPRKSTFCSSVPGKGIPGDKYFVKYIKQKLAKPNVIVLLIVSDHFLTSVFSLCELGATWALNLTSYPLLLPTVKYEDLKAVLTGKQGQKLDSLSDLTLLRQQLLRFFPESKKNPIENITWENERSLFLERVKRYEVSPVATHWEKPNSGYHETAQSLKFYDKIAWHYDDEVSEDFVKTHNALNDVILAQIDKKPNPTVLDLGGGTGKILGTFQKRQGLKWFYCDASRTMNEVFKSNFSGCSIIQETCCMDASAYLKRKRRTYDVIVMSFVLSSMPRSINFNLLAGSLAAGGALIIAEANPTYSLGKPLFKITTDKRHKLSLKIRPIDESSLADSARTAGLRIIDLVGIDKGDHPYSYIAVFQ